MDNRFAVDGPCRHGGDEDQKRAGKGCWVLGLHLMLAEQHSCSLILYFPTANNMTFLSFLNPFIAPCMISQLTLSRHRQLGR